MSILFKGNIEEGNYTLIKSTDGWVLKGETSYVGFNMAEPKTGEWIFSPKDAIDLMFTKLKCSKCGFESSDGGNFCSNCGARMRGEEE